MLGTWLPRMTRLLLAWPKKAVRPTRRSACDSACGDEDTGLLPGGGPQFYGLFPTRLRSERGSPERQKVPEAECGKARGLCTAPSRPRPCSYIAIGACTPPPRPREAAAPAPRSPLGCFRGLLAASYYVEALQFVLTPSQ
eukprot:scaffold20644_cov129-Isochrysis_galbana.AAC.1